MTPQPTVQFKLKQSNQDLTTRSEFETDDLYIAVLRIEEFLKGCGFQFDGLEIKPNKYTVTKH